MRKIFIGILAIALELLTGCVGVVSLHPLVTDSDKDAFLDPGLVGSWRQASPDDSQIWVVTRYGPNGYKASATEDGAEKAWVFHILKLPDRYLLDVLDDLGDAALPAHVYFALTLQKDILKVSEMDTPWLKQQVAGREGLRSEVLAEEDGKVVITSPQGDLRKYFLPLAADSRSFADESELHRVK
jgi:hypothetical protein